MSEILTINFEPKSLPNSKASEIGQIGEDLAAKFLIRRGFRLVCSNFKVPIGRNIRGAAVTGEIDLIALDADVLCFIEVKTRSSDEFATPLSAVDVRKQRQITRTARIYRKIFNLQSFKIRYDVVSIVLQKEKSPNIELFKNFWTEEKFRKKFWNDEIW
ncbi:MAG TPA: YraN family protein [Pyrinomonadaceae bacterium]|nr:YraN family protein [Pyrinomonadaceae bacterium]